MPRSSCSAREQVPEAQPRITSDNGPQFIARDFKSFLRIAGMTHVRTSPHGPQSNGKLKRYHRTIKSDALRVKSPSCRAEVRRTPQAWHIAPILTRNFLPGRIPGHHGLAFSFRRHVNR